MKTRVKVRIPSLLSHFFLQHEPTAAALSQSGRSLLVGELAEAATAVWHQWKWYVAFTWSILLLFVSLSSLYNNTTFCISVYHLIQVIILLLCNSHIIFSQRQQVTHLLLFSLCSPEKLLTKVLTALGSHHDSTDIVKWVFRASDVVFKKQSSYSANNRKK